MRVRFYVAPLFLLAVFPLHAEPWSTDWAFKVKRVGSVAVSPDGSQVAYVVGTAVMEGEKSEWLSHVHLARADGSGGTQLTRGEQSANNPAWSADGKWIVFLSTRGAKDPKAAKANLWRIPVAGGEAERLTDEKGGIRAFQLSPDGQTVAFLMTDPKSDEEEEAEKEKRDARVVGENLKMTRLYVVPFEPDAEDGRPVRLLTPGALSLGSVVNAETFDWAPDGRQIAFTHQPTNSADDWTRWDVSVVEVASGAVRPLAATGAAERDPVFSPDGRSVALVASNDPPTWYRRARVVVYPAAGGAGSTPRALAETPDALPDLVGWLDDGRLLVTESFRTVERVYVLPADGRAAVPFSPADANMDNSALNAARTHIGFTAMAPDKPVEAFVTPAASFAPTQVSREQNLPPVEMGRTEVISWKAPDGMTIEGLVTYPSAYRAGTRVPLLVIVHGGPAGVFSRNFVGAPTAFPLAGFAARGFAVLRANVRGSTGYGYDFRAANVRDWGGGDYRDILAGVDHLIAQGVADPERLGIMGWSYGGYMTSWIITQTNRFKAATVGAGVTNLMSFTGTADIPSFLPSYFGGEVWEDGGLELWSAHSAMFKVKGVTTPTLILHGENDLRVPISQGFELHNALKRQGVTVQMVTYPRQPHGIQEPKLLQDAMERNLEWFERWIKP